MNFFGGGSILQLFNGCLMASLSERERRLINSLQHLVIPMSGGGMARSNLFNLRDGFLMPQVSALATPEPRLPDHGFPLTSRRLSQFGICGTKFELRKVGFLAHRSP